MIGSVSYYPLADGTAIVTKQLQNDGTSKMIVYKPINEQEIKYVTESDLMAQFEEFSSKSLKDIKEEIKSLKKQLRDISEDIEDKKGA